MKLERVPYLLVKKTNIQMYIDHLQLAPGAVYHPYTYKSELAFAILCGAHSHLHLCSVALALGL